MSRTRLPWHPREWRFILWLTLLNAALFAIILTASGQMPPAQSDQTTHVDPTIFLGTEHGGSVVHDRALPLLLRVRLANPVAANIQMRNAESAETEPESSPPGKSAETKNKAKLQNHPVLPVPSVALDSTQNQLPALLSFELRDAKGKPLNIAVRRLHSTEFPQASLVLDGTANPQFRYGIDSAELAKLEPGNYSVRAILSNKGAGAGEWSGRAESAPLAFELRSGDLSTDQRQVDIHQAGRFYLHDRDYANVETEAAALLALDKLSVSAWELRGDAFVEQNKLDDAEKAFEEALHNAQQRPQAGISPPLREPPEYLYQRLDKIRQLRKTSPK